MSNNTKEHNISDLGIVYCGATPSTLYKQLKYNQIEYVANLMQAKVAIVGDLELFEEVNKAKKDLSVSIERRIAAANDQISSAQAAAIREVRNKAITIAISAVEEVISSNIDSKQRSELIDSAVKEVEEKLH